jgi:hypothetical protein
MPLGDWLRHARYRAALHELGRARRTKFGMTMFMQIDRELDTRGPELPFAHIESQKSIERPCKAANC